MKHAPFWCSITVIGALLAGCGDDDKPTGPGPTPTDTAWPRVSVNVPPRDGMFGGIAFSGSRGLAAGASIAGVLPVLSFDPFLATRAVDGTWEADAASLPVNAILTAVGFSSTGDAFVSGFDYATTQGFVLDERGGWSRHDVAVGGLVFAVGGGTARVAGSGSAQLAVSTAADVWMSESLPFPGSAGERGLSDIDTRGGTWAACGFDDGADGSPSEPNAVLFWTNGGPWTRLDVPCGGCTNFEFRAVAVSATGAVFLGGAITDFGAGAADDYVAFLFSRSATGVWTEIVLPDAGGLDRVNDMLITSGGDMYLTCGLESACVVRSPSAGSPVLDATFPSAQIRRLAEDPDGSVWAAGGIVGDDSSAFAIWKRPDAR